MLFTIKELASVIQSNSDPIGKTHTAIFLFQAAHKHDCAHVVPASQVRTMPSQWQYVFSQMLVSDRPASQDTWVAVVMVRAERTAAMARVKRILLAEMVGREGSWKILVKKLGGNGWSKRLVEQNKNFRRALLDDIYTWSSSKDSCLLCWHHDLPSKAPACIIPRHDVANEEKASDTLTLLCRCIACQGEDLVGFVMKPIHDEKDRFLPFHIRRGQYANRPL